MHYHHSEDRSTIDKPAGKKKSVVRMLKRAQRHGMTAVRRNNTRRETNSSGIKSFEVTRTIQPICKASYCITLHFMDGTSWTVTPLTEYLWQHYGMWGSPIENGTEVHALFFLRGEG